ncbi:MAG: polysaccharide deacetylase family protein [Candidatus Binataceae bacterium]
MMRRAYLITVPALSFSLIVLIGTSALFNASAVGAEQKKPFQWPAGKHAAISLSFDDARLSQPDVGLALLEKCGVKATFFVEPRNAEPRLEGWKKIVAAGHEIGNHSQSHPCTGNYAFSLANALEDYTLDRMAKDLDGGSADIERLLGVKPKTFAYPCGLKFVGRGRDVRSYVPLVAERYLVARGYLDEAANDPAFCDLAQAMGTGFDDMDFAGMKKLVDQAAKDGRWVIFVGHEIGQKGFQITDTAALEALCKYAKDPANGIWIDTVENVGRYVQQQRGQ